MRVKPLILFSTIYLLLKFSHFTLAEIPNCAFEDTVALNDNHKQPNGSYVYGGVLVPAHLIGYYDYDDFESKRVPKHLRGCVCQLKPCVKFCCQPNEICLRETVGTPLQCFSVNAKYSPLINITLRNSRRVPVNVFDKFVVQQGISCGDGFMLRPRNHESNKWELLENGSIALQFDKMPISRRDYCLTAMNGTVPGNGAIFELNAVYCKRTEKSKPIMINTIILMISAPFLYITILVYWLVPKLWNLHTKCLLCYLLSLAISTTLIVVVNMRETNYANAMCAIIGYIMYYFLLAVFFWLNVICFDLWKIFRGTQINVQHSSERKRFRYYSLYAWGLPGAMTIIANILQYSNLPDDLKSGIGDRHCGLKTEAWSTMLYLYGPCLILIISNIVMFYTTVRRIYIIRREVQQLAQDDYTQRRMRAHQKNVWLFFRMFIIMGLNWLLEIISYLIGNPEGYDVVIAIMTGFNAMEGIIVFILLVMKKKVLLLIKRVICESIEEQRRKRRTTTALTTSQLISTTT